MCGIGGVLSPDPIAHLSVPRMLPRLAHRGPDGEGIWASPGGNCTLGHTRLAIIDLSDASAQPFRSASGELVLVYNGEIYNYRELRAELRSTWHFRSDGDTEVLLAAYSRWGKECLAHLNGMFAFALWDERAQSLFLARDRFGEKPLYFTASDDGFIFASELRALAEAPVSVAMNEAAILAHLASDTIYDLDGQSRTLLAGISQLPPGHYLTATFNPVAKIVTVGPATRYWSPVAASQPPRSLQAAASELRELLRDSVRLRLRSDVPVGTCLSGGLDSSSVVATMRRLDPDRTIHTFTGRFPGESVDEGHFAKEMSDWARTTYHDVDITVDGFLREAPDLYRSAEFPIGSLSQYAQWCVFRLAKEHGVTVLLDGQGSDEVFGGYGYEILRAYASQLIVDHRIRFYLCERMRLYRRVPSVFSLRSSAKLLLSSRLASKGPHQNVSRLLSPDARAAACQAARSTASPTRRPLRQVLNTLALTTMLPSLIRYGDRLSMHFSREVRLPFCDHRIIELSNTLAPEHLLGGGEVKLVLKESMRDDLPISIRTREKQGFNPPLSRWIQGPLVPWMRDVIHTTAPELRSLLNEKALDAALARASVGRAPDWPALWRIANLCAWDSYSRQPLAERAGSSMH